MRQILGEENPNISPPEYLCFDRKAISTEAYRRIARIENMLRNLIVSEYYSKNGTDLYDNLKAITLNSYISEDQENLIKLVLFHVRSELRINFENEITKTNDEKLSFTNPSKTDLLKDAQNWQKRQRENHAVELSQDNIMHFLTTESLGKVLNYKKSGFHGDKKMFKKELLTTIMDEYTIIRSAVAHNQPIKLSTISRLDNLERKIIDCITVFADNTYHLQSNQD